MAILWQKLKNKHYATLKAISNGGPIEILVDVYVFLNGNKRIVTLEKKKQTLQNKRKNITKYRFLCCA